MEELLKNPNLVLDILPKVLLCMSDQELLSFYLFWINWTRKVYKHCLSINNFERWIKFFAMVVKVERTRAQPQDLVKSFHCCSIEIFLKLQFFNRSGYPRNEFESPKHATLIPCTYGIHSIPSYFFCVEM